MIGGIKMAPIQRGYALPPKGTGMTQACPINFSSVDNTTSRIVSFLTALILVLSIVSGSVLWLYLLGADIAVRLYGNKQFSIIYRAAQGIKQMLRLPTRNVDGAAKKVAGHFGLLFILLLIAASRMQLTITGDLLAGIYLLCLSLDVAVNFCIGCKVYYLYRILAERA